MFERIVRVSPAWDKRDPDPKKDYGVGACKITFVLKGAKGAVQFVIGTDWYLPHTQRKDRDWQHDYNTRFDKIAPTGWDVGYHSPVPMYEDQTKMGDDCEYVHGGTCYYDGSSLRADEWVPKFLEGGTDWLWPALEQEYAARFETVEAAA